MSEKELRTHIEYIRKALDRLEDKMVTRAEFEPVKRVVYTLVALMITGVAGGVIKLVLA